MSEHEVEKAAKQTAEEYENVSEGMLTEALLTGDAGSVTGDFSSDVLAERFVSIAQNRVDGQLAAEPEEVIDEFLNNIEQEVSQKNDEVHRALQAEFRQQQTTSISELLEQSEEIREILEPVDLAGTLEKRSSEIEIIETPKINREAYYYVTYPVQNTEKEWEEHIKVPVAQIATIENTGDGVVENCQVWLDFIQLDTNHDSYGNVLKPGLRFPNTPGAQAEIFHLQTRLPWGHPTTDGTITLGPHESVEVEFLGETRGAYSFVFPSPEGFPEPASANLYVGRNPDAMYPTDWWWLAERESKYVFNEPFPNEEYVCFLRVTGSNIEPRYAMVEFDWDGWNEQPSTPLPISLTATQTVETELSVPLDGEALRDTFGGIPKMIAQPTGPPAAHPSPIEVIGDPDEPLPPEISFSRKIPTPDDAAFASLALEEFDEFAFSYYEYVLAATARRVTNPEDREYYSVSEVANGLFEAEEDLSKQVLQREMPSIEGSSDFVNEETEIQISDAAVKDLKACPPETRGQHIDWIAHLRELENIPGAPLQQLASVSLDRPLYEFADKGIVLWIAPNRATPAVSNSIDTITVETAIDADEWDRYVHLMSPKDREDVEKLLEELSDRENHDEE